MPETTDRIDQAAGILWTAAQKREVCQPVRSIIGTEDIQTAYAIQTKNIEKRVAAGARRVGKKIGLTSLAVQRQLGVDQPDYGILLDTMEVLNGGEISCRALMQPKVEAEIALVLARDLTSPHIGTVEVLSAVDYALAAVEIVGSRIENWNIRITDTIADNASASHFVLGHRPVRLENIDLISCSASLEKNGEPVSAGSGAACLGSPVNATLWLARRMAALGQPLLAGDIILSGAVGPMVDVEAGDEVRAVFDSLGEVNVRFVP